MKDYLKYIDLAETHDGSTVDSWGSDLKTEGQADDMYSRIEEDVRAFPFGKAHDVPLGRWAPHREKTQRKLHTPTGNKGLIKSLPR